MNIGFAMCGSFCTFSKVFPIMEQLTEKFYESPDVRVMDILSEGILCSSPSLEDIGSEKDEIDW